MAALQPAEERRSGGGRATSRDVAAASGVSQATVSNVINHPDLVATETRERVRAAMDRLDFVIHEPARLLRAGRAAAIGLCVPDVSNPFWGEVTRGAAAAATEHGSALIVCSSEESAVKEGDLLRLLEQQRVGGILVAPLEPELAQLDQVVERGTPVALLNRHDTRGLLPFVAVDDVEGARLVGEYLLALGHRRIAVVNGSTVISWCADRWRGICLAAEQAGLDPEDVLHQVPVDAQKTSEGERVASDVLDLAPRVTAVFCVNDLLGLGVLRGLTQRGVNVPRDMSLVGYDDDDFTEMLLPALTTVRQEPYRLGYAAAARLIQRKVLGHPKAPEGDGAILVPELVVRESARRPRGTPAGQVVPLKQQWATP
jgi:LacI family transcriptional regulator